MENASTSAAPPADESGLHQLWHRLTEAVARVSPFTKSYLLEAHPVSFNKNVFIIGFDPEFEDHIGLVDNAKNHTLLQTKLSELGHPNSQIKFIKAEAPSGWGQNQPEPAPAPELPKTTPVSTPKAAAAAPATPAPAPVKEKTSFNKDEFKNDPLIQKALEVFKGTIVEVRA